MQRWEHVSGGITPSDSGSLVLYSDAEEREDHLLKENAGLAKLYVDAEEKAGAIEEERDRLKASLRLMQEERDLYAEQRDNLARKSDRLKAEIARMKEHTWCAYCGLEIHIDDEAATKISEHIMACEKHPIHIALADNDRQKAELAATREVLKNQMQCVSELKMFLHNAQVTLAEREKEVGNFRWLITQVLNDLPLKRDWLNPDYEKMMKVAALAGKEADDDSKT